MLLTLERRSDKKERMSEGPLHLLKKISTNWFLFQQVDVLRCILSTVDLLIMTHG